MPVGELLRRMSAQEFAEWMAFFEMEPWGYDMENWRFGMLAATMANLHRDPKKRRKPYRPEDFMPKSRREKRAKSWQDLKAIARLWNRVLGGREGRSPSADGNGG